MGLSGPQGPGLTRSVVKVALRLWFVTVRDAEGFGEYQRRVAGVAARYGAVERSIVPEAVVGEGEGEPTVVNLVRFYGEHGDIERDPEFAAVEPLRAASSELRWIDGWVEVLAPAPESTEDGPVYLVEVARFTHGAGPYHVYRERADQVMARYGERVEAVFTPTAWSEGWPFDPDVVSIVSFATAEGMARFEQDPAHADLEGDAYAAVVAQSIWVVGRTARP